MSKETTKTTETKPKVDKAALEQSIADKDKALKSGKPVLK